MKIIQTIIDSTLHRIKSWKQVVTVAIVLIFILIFYWTVKIGEENMIFQVKKEVKSEIVDSLSRFNSLKVSNVIKQSPKVDVVINSILDNINSQLDFNRSAIWIYHNGIDMSNGIPYSRMSMSHERIREERMIVKPLSLEMQSIPISIFLEMNKNLFERGYYMQNVNNLKHSDKTAYYYYSTYGITGYAAVLIKNSDGLPLGVLIGYTYDRDFVEGKAQTRDLLIHDADIIENLLKYEI